jgi:hypothetical protein
VEGYGLVIRRSLKQIFSATSDSGRLWFSSGIGWFSLDLSDQKRVFKGFGKKKLTDIGFLVWFFFRKQDFLQKLTVWFFWIFGSGLILSINQLLIQK